MRSGTMTPRAAVHGSLWYEDPWYRLAWLALPQAGTVLLANLLFALVAQGEWGRPATGSRQRAAELEILRDRAGGEGDAAALNQLAAGAKAGEIDAQTRLATLYDPLVAGRFPRKTVPSDRARATELYRAGSEAGDLMAMARLADLLLEEAVSEDDRRRGCRLAKAWLDHPATTRDMLRGEERLAEKLARCLVDAESGIPQDPRRAGDLIVDTLRLKYEPSIRTYVRGLGLHKPALIRALQEAMAARTIGRYTGPVDGLVHPETIAALEREAGLRPFLPEPAPERRAAIGTGLTAEEFRSLAQAATRDLAALARVQAIADRGDATALATLGYLYSPFLNKGEVFAPDAQRSAANFERAAAAGARDAAAQAAGLYDKGAGALEKDPDRAASLILRQLELDPGYQTFLTDPVFGATWSPAFWGALQRALAARGIYTNPVENRRNDAVIAAIRRFAQANGTARSPSRP